MAEVIAKQASGMEPGEFTTVAYRCRCGHEWAPRPLGSSQRPKACPKCKSANWDQPYKFHRKSDTSQYIANLSEAQLMALLIALKYHPDWTDDEILQEMADCGVSTEEAKEAIDWAREGNREPTDD